MSVGICVYVCERDREGERDSACVWGSEVNLKCMILIFAPFETVPSSSQLRTRLATPQLLGFSCLLSIWLQKCRGYSLLQCPALYGPSSASRNVKVSGALRSLCGREVAQEQRQRGQRRNQEVEREEGRRISTKRSFHAKGNKRWFILGQRMREHDPGTKVQFSRIPHSHEEAVS